MRTLSTRSPPPVKTPRHSHPSSFDHSSSTHAQSRNGATWPLVPVKNASARSAPPLARIAQDPPHKPTVNRPTRIRSALSEHSRGLDVRRAGLRAHPDAVALGLE